MPAAIRAALLRRDHRRDGRAFWIYYRGDLPPSELRITLGHELGHIRLDGTDLPCAKGPALPDFSLAVIGKKWVRSQLRAREDAADHFSRAVAIGQETFRHDVAVLPLEQCHQHYGVDVRCLAARIHDLFPKVTYLVHEYGKRSRLRRHPSFYPAMQPSYNLTDITAYLRWHSKDIIPMGTWKAGGAVSGLTYLHHRGETFAVRCEHVPASDGGRFVLLATDRSTADGPCRGVFHDA